jgi:GNAT superfamily N-acetyltransferase
MAREVREISIVAARAFYFDPFCEFLLPSAARRARGVAVFTSALVTSELGCGRVFVARQHHHIVGAAAWVAPERYPLPVRRQLRQAAAALWAVKSRPGIIRPAFAYLTAIDKVHPRDPLWYLSLLVVDPTIQRTGLGGLLQQPILAEADASGIDCYLETQKDENLAYYRRFGYEVVDELHPAASGPPLWTMRRPARR